MRSSRYKRNKKRGGEGFSYVLFFIIGSIVSIILGAGVVKYIVLPQFVPDDDTTKSSINDEAFKGDDPLEYTEYEKEDPVELEKSTFQLSSLELYGIQLGNFSTRENARTFIKEISNKGMNGYIVENNGYRVLIGNYFTRDKADEKIVEIRKEYSDAFISSASIEGKNVEYYIVDEGSKNKLKETVEVLNSSFSEESSLWEETINSKNTEEIINLLTENNNILKSKLNEIENNPQSSKLIELLNKINDTISIRENILTNLKDNPGEVSNIYKDFDNNLYEYINFISEF